MTPNEDKILLEVWNGCEEQLLEIHPNYWGDYLVPVLIRMIFKEREQKDYYKKQRDTLLKKVKCNANN